MDIELKNIYKSYGDKVVLKNFSASFKEGALTCLMGQSGCGKTTVLNLLMGLDKADGGSISGIEKGSISAVFQEDRLCEGFNAVTNIAMVGSKNLKAEKIIENLEAIGLKDCFHKPVSELSGGMKRRVAIVRAMMAEGKLLILDEPFKGLDKENLKLACNYVKSFSRGRTVIMVTHSPEEAEIMGGRVIYM